MEPKNVRYLGESGYLIGMGSVVGIPRDIILTEETVRELIRLIKKKDGELE